MSAVMAMNRPKWRKIDAIVCGTVFTFTFDDSWKQNLRTGKKDGDENDGINDR